MKEFLAPPSKSLTHRAIMCASLSRGTSVIKNPLISDDTKRTLECCSALGATCNIFKDKIEITGLKEYKSNKKVKLNVGESGTTCRLITPIVGAIQGIEAFVFGEGRMHKRPIGELINVLSSLSCKISYNEKQGYPPFTIRSSGLKGGVTQISLEKSSQYLSGLLLAAPIAKADMEIHVIGKKAVSWPYVGLTIQTMKKFGIDVSIYEAQEDKWIKKELGEITYVEPGKIKFVVKKGKYKPCDFFVEGDWSNASYLVAAGLLLEMGLKIRGLFKNSIQGDRKIIDILTKMGARILWDKDVIVAHPSNLHGIEIDMKECPDLVPTVAVLASMADSKTVITGVEHLKLKESDRLMGVANEVKKVGAKVEVFDDGLSIKPNPLPIGQEISFSTYADHRMAMSLSLYELKGIKVKLDNKSCVAKSFPNFFDLWEKVKN